MTSAYVAASSRELPRAEAAIAHARSLGLLVSYDWTASFRALEREGRSPADQSLGEMQRQALLDLRGVKDCRVLILLASVHESEARVEVGYALAAGKPIVVSRETAPARFFDVLCAHECGTDRAAVEKAAAMAGGERG